jgi:hypothetical protein
MNEETRLYGELYTSPAFNTAHQELLASPGEPGCNLPRAIVALMFWSDATRLSTFTNTKLWPVYMFFGNESKYRRCTPSFKLCEHIAYFETVCSTRSSFFLLMLLTIIFSCLTRSKASLVSPLARRGN